MERHAQHSLQRCDHRKYLIVTPPPKPDHRNQTLPDFPSSPSHPPSSKLTTRHGRFWQIAATRAVRNLQKQMTDVPPEQMSVNKPKMLKISYPNTDFSELFISSIGIRGLDGLARQPSNIFTTRFPTTGTTSDSFSSPSRGDYDVEAQQHSVSSTPSDRTKRAPFLYWTPLSASVSIPFPPSYRQYHIDLTFLCLSLSLIFIAPMVIHWQTFTSLLFTISIFCL